jgi:hypothetical protein
MAFVVLSMVSALISLNYYRFRFEQDEASFHFFTLIPNQLVEKMKDYYMTVRQQVIEKDHLAQIDHYEEEVFAIDNHELSKVEEGRFSSFSKVRLINYNKFYRWIVTLTVFLFINGLNYLSTSNIRNFFDPSIEIIDKTNRLNIG